VLDVLKPLGDKKIIESELEGFGIRLNKKPPNIMVRKKERGGECPSCFRYNDVPTLAQASRSRTRSH
jgi:hypothetical protein